MDSSPQKPHNGTAPTANVPAISKTTAKTSSSVILLLVAAVFVLAAIGIYFVWKKGGAPTQTADQIRSAFSPPAPAPANPFIPPQPSQQNNSFNANTAAVQNTQPNPAPAVFYQAAVPALPRGVNPGPASPATENQPQANIYQNAEMGFQLTLPAGWTAKPQGGQIWFYNSSTGSSEGFIESYPSNGATLADIETILKQSPSVNHVSQTTADNQPALRYAAGSLLASGLAVIDSGQVFYLHGAVAEPATAATFHAIAGTNYSGSGAARSQSAGSTGVTYYNQNGSNLP